MYNKKPWFPTEIQKEEIKSLLKNPGWWVIMQKAEFEHSESGKSLLSMLQVLDAKNPDDMLTLEKEWIQADAVELFLKSIERYTYDNISSPDDNEN